MTTDATELQDEVSKQQEGMDAEQQGEIPAVISPEDDRLSRIEKTLEALDSNLRGLQGREDSSLASMQRQITAQLQGQLDELQQGQTQRKMADELAQVPEDVRPFVAPLYQRIANLEARPGQASVATEPSMSDTERQMRVFVQEMGVDPNAPEIDYSILGGTPGPQMLAAFMKTVPVQGKEQKQATNQDSQQQSARTPPADTGPGRAGVRSTPDEVRDRFIKGETDADKYREDMNALGATP